MNRVLLSMMLITGTISGCYADDGSISGGRTSVLVLLIVVLIIAIKRNNLKLQSKDDENRRRNDEYSEFFACELKKLGIIFSNTYTRLNESGIAIDDNKEFIVTIDKDRNIRKIGKDKIVKCELEVLNETIVQAKSKAPIVTWNTIDKTNGTMSSVFRKATLKITVDDVDHPVQSVDFYHQETANRYKALVDIIHNSKTV